MSFKKTTENFRGFNFNKVIKSILIVLPIGVLGNLLFSWFSTDRNIFMAFVDFPLHYFLVCLVLGVVPWFTHSFRMLLWIRFLNQSIPFKEILKIAIGTELGAGVSPTAMGGGPLKAGMLVQQNLECGKAISLTLLGSIEDYSFFLLAIPLTFLFSGSWKTTFISEIPDQVQIRDILVYVVGFGMAIFALVFIFRKNLWQINDRVLKSRFNQKFKDTLLKVFQDIVRVYRLIGQKGKWLFLLTVSITGLHWLAKFSVVIFMLKGLGLPVDPVQFYLLQWVVFICMLFIPTPGAMIGAEASFYFVFQSVIPQSMIGIVTPAWRFLTYYVQLGLGAIVFSWLHFSPVRKMRAAYLFDQLE